MPQYGYVPTYGPPRQQSSPLASAAARDPYGLAPNNRRGLYGANPLGALSPASGFRPAVSASFTGPASASARGLAGQMFTAPAVTAAPPVPAPTTPPKASDVNSYDLSTDPALQQIQSLVGMSDEGAQSAALKQRENLLLAYGDPSIARSVLGADDPIVTAAGQNPTSTVAQLGQQRDRNLHALDEALNNENLGYSGYRITQETQAGQDFQNALARAAGDLNSNLDSVSGNLNAALAGNNAQRAQAISDAAARAQAAAAASGIDPGATNGTGTGAGGTASGTNFESSGGYGGVPLIPLSQLEQQALTSDVHTPGLQSDPTGSLAMAAAQNDVFEPSIGTGTTAVSSPWQSPALPGSEASALLSNVNAPGSIVDTAVPPAAPPIVPAPAPVTTNDALLQLLAQARRPGLAVG